MTLCWLYRTMASLWLDAEERLPRFVRAHVSACAFCRDRLQRERQVHGQLAASARGEDAPMPPFLPARILSRVRASGADGRLAHLSSTVRRHPLGLALAGLVALGLVIALLQVRKTATYGNGSNLSAVREATGQSAALILGTPADLPRWGGLLERPLEGEIVLAMEDGRRALAGMVQSVVPDAAAQTLLRQAGQLWTGPHAVQPRMNVNQRE